MALSTFIEFHRLHSKTIPALRVKYMTRYTSDIKCLPIFFGSSEWNLSHWSDAISNHSGHSLTYNFLCRISQINSQYMQENYTIKSREILGIGQREKLEN
jgi:hypothetical protein